MSRRQLDTYDVAFVHVESDANQRVNLPAAWRRAKQSRPATFTFCAALTFKAPVYFDQRMTRLRSTTDINHPAAWIFHTSSLPYSKLVAP